MHGGLSTGPRTPAGLARSKRARWKHGRFAAEARHDMEHFRELLRECKELAELMSASVRDDPPQSAIEKTWFGGG
jgi:hypothetical protein